jgi:hypothetical protein
MALSGGAGHVPPAGHPSGSSSHPSHGDPAGGRGSSTMGPLRHRGGAAAFSDPDVDSWGSGRSELALHDGRGVQSSSCQPDLGPCATSVGLQCGDWQVDLDNQAPCWWYTRALQGALGPSGVHSASRCGLWRDFQSSGEACYSAHDSLFGSLSVLARALARCQECISSWHSDRDRLLQPARRVCELQLPRYGLSVEQVSVWFE